MLAALFQYNRGIEMIRKKARRYFEKFFELSVISQHLKKLVTRILFTIVSNMPDCFDVVEKAAINHARDNESTPFKSLI